MAKNETSNELLGYVLDDLDELLKITKKEQKEAKESNVPPTLIAKVLASNGGVNNIAAVLNSFVAIKILSKVKKADVEHVADLMNTLATAIKGMNVTKEEAEGFDRMMNTFGTMTKMLGEMSGNVFKNFFKFNYVSGWALGKRLGKFYKGFLKGFEKEKLGDFLKDFKESEHLGSNLAGFSQVIATIFAIDWKQLLKVGLALLMFPKKAGENLASFFSPIISCINMLPEDHKTSDIVSVKDGKIDKSAAFSADSRIKSFMDIFNMFAMLPIKSLFVLKKLGDILNKERGKNIKEFFEPVIRMITKEFKDDESFDKKINHFYLLFKLFAKSPLLAALKIKMLSLVMDAKTGKKIGGFFSSLIKEINKCTEKETDSAVRMVKAFTLMMTAMTLSFVAIVAMVMLAKPLQILAAAAILVGLVYLSIFTIKKLSDKKIAANAKGACYTAGITAFLMLALTAVLSIVVAIVANNKLEDIILGSLLLVGVVGLSLFVLKKMGDKKITANGKDALMAAGTMILIMLAMTGIAAIAIAIGEYGLKSLFGLGIIVLTALAGEWMLKKMMKLGKDKGKLLNGILAIGAIALGIIALSVAVMAFAGMAEILSKVGLKDTLIALVISTAMTGGMYVLLKTCSKMKPKQMLMGVAGIGVLALGIAAISGAMIVWANYLNKVKDLTLKQVALGSGIALAVIAAVIAIEVAAAACISGPQAIVFAIGLAAAATLSAGILAIGGSLSVFAEFLIKTKQLTVEDVQNATKMVVGKGGMVGCIKDMLVGLSSVSLWAVVKMGIIGKNLGPMFTALSQFVDVIQKMGAMWIVDHFEKDKDGNQVPIYRKMAPEEFTAAAVSLSDSFGHFIDTLCKSFDSPEKRDSIKAAMKILKKGDIGQLMEGVGTFAKAIIDFASLRVADEWDKEGNPIHYSKLKDEDFKNAAVTLSNAFTTFLSTLYNSMKDSPKTVKKLMDIFIGDEEDGETITNLINQVCSVIDPLVKISTGKWNDIEISKEKLIAASDTLVTPIVDFIERTNKIEAKAALKLITSIKSISSEIKEIANNFAKIKGQEFATNSKEVLKGSLYLFKTLDRVKKSYGDKSHTYKNALYDIQKGLKKLRPEAKKSWKPIAKMTAALRQFDTLLLEKREERNEAMLEITDNFKSMTDQMMLLNDELGRAVDLYEQYQELKLKYEESMWQKIQNGVESVGQGISGAITDIKTAIVGPKKEDEETPQIDNVGLVNALTSALNAWTATTKNITLELSDQGVMAIGKVYMGDQ